MFGVKNIETQTLIIQSKQRPLAPAPERLIFNNKRKFTNYVGTTTSQQPASVARRNARERNRVKLVNNGFAALRQHIPASVLNDFGAGEASGNGRNASKKLSKVDTLRVAVEYIKRLQRMLEEHHENEDAKNMIDLFGDSRDSSIRYSPYASVISTPPTSETSVSPTPSHNSEISAAYPAAMIFVHDGFKQFEPRGPDDEELLDAIFLGNRAIKKEVKRASL